MLRCFEDKYINYYILSMRKRNPYNLYNFNKLNESVMTSDGIMVSMEHIDKNYSIVSHNGKNNVMTKDRRVIYKPKEPDKWFTDIQTIFGMIFSLE